MDKAGLKLDAPQTFGDYLGCGQAPITLTKEQVKDRLQHIDPIRIGSGGYGEPDGSAVIKKNHPIRAIRYDMTGFLVQCIDKYLELAKLAKDKLKPVATPSIDDHQISPEDFEERGDLASCAAKIVMKVLYGARFLRYDLLWPLASVARQISKWNKASDRRLHRLVSYLNTTIDYSLESFVGDDPEDCVVLQYCDASFADDIRESKSTSGCYLAITGPNAFVPATSFSKRQGAVSHSSTEAEIISLEEAVRSEGLAVLAFWEHVVLLFGEHRRTRQSSK